MITTWCNSRRALGALVVGLFFAVTACMPLQAVELDELFGPYQEILTDHRVEKDLEGNGLVTAFRYREAVDDQDAMRRLQTQRGPCAHPGPCISMAIRGACRNCSNGTRMTASRKRTTRAPGLGNLSPRTPARPWRRRRGFA